VSIFVREPTYSVPPDPHWPSAAAWLRGDLGPGDPKHAELGVLGIPLSASSPAPNGSHATPFVLRRHLERFAPFAGGVGWPESFSVFLPDALRIRDFGVLDIGHLTNVPAQDAVRDHLRRMFGDGGRHAAPDLLASIGGDDAIMRPLLHGLYPDLSSVGLLTLDSHHDVRVGYRAQGPHNGAPIRYLLEEGLKGTNVVQIGIAPFGNSAVYRKFAEDNGITIVGSAAARRQGVASTVERFLSELAARVDVVVVDIDLDVIEAGYSPACPGARPGGLAPWEVHEACLAIGREPKVRALCLVEVDPTLDPFGTGVDNVCLCLLHAAAGLSTRGVR
jgi:formiminoglutamase